MPAVNFQAGILDHPPEHVLVAALSFVAPDAPTCLAAMRSLRELVHRELAADIDEIDPDTNPAAPSTDTGELGVETEYDTTNLTITVGISTSGFQRLGVNQPPADLIPISWGAFDDQPTNANEGDVIVQACADSSYIIEHVLRRIEHTLGNSFSVVWTLTGEQRDGGDHGGRTTVDTGRALIGFLDGLSNLDPSDPTDQELIFVGQQGAPPYPVPPPPGQQPGPQPNQPGYGQPGQPGPIFPNLRPPPAGPEPAWATDGSYLMIRASLLNIAQWDQETMAQQQQTVGRWKYSGATLDNPNSPAHRRDVPDFQANPTDVAVPPNSHIRRANPRALPTDPQRRIFRRGYPLILPSTQGSLQRGLLFIAFGRSLSSQVEFILQAWLKNQNFPEPQSGVDPILALEAQVLAGGYYFVPPVASPDERWNWQIPGL
jgi:deferrochelatase/peroxidase EfeB